MKKFLVFAGEFIVFALFLLAFVALLALVP